MNLPANEISSITQATDVHTRIALIDPYGSDATVEDINLEGYEFKGLVCGNGLTDEAIMIINLDNGMTFHLLKVPPYTDEDLEKRQAVRASAEQLNEVLFGSTHLP